MGVHMANHSLSDLFNEYVQQRENNTSPEDALRLLTQLQPNLGQPERQQLGQAIRQWELKRTSMATHQDDETLPTIQVEPEAAHKILCPHCQTPNPSEAKYCYSCGQLISMAYSAQTGVLPDDEADPAMFGNLATLMIAVDGHDNKPLRLKVGDRPLTIGRADPTASSQPDIDLMPYGGADLGVSRLHAVLQRTQQTLTLSDKGSVNHTYINGEKLHPHEIRVIRDGDEIRFGRLQTRFIFHREVRRLG